MATNTVAIDPQTLQTIQSLPAAWQHYAIAAVLLLMLLGRVATAVAANAGIVGAVKSMFMGSAHVGPPTSATLRSTAQTAKTPTPSA